MNNDDEIILFSGSSELSIAQSTGKITSLICKQKSLLVEPEPSERNMALSDTGRSQFKILDAWGGDECFPSVGGSELWRIRDHGMIWGKTPTLNFAHDSQCTSVWQCDEAQLHRTILGLSKVDPETCLGGYLFKLKFSDSVSPKTSNDEQHLSLNIRSIYASHALFSAQPGDLIEWGVIDDHTEIDSLLLGQYIRRVSTIKNFAPDQAPIASKFYLECPAGKLFYTSLVRKKLGVRIDIIQNSSFPYVGIWWCHNAWGDGRPHSTVGIEPTNLPSDGPILSLIPPARRAEHSGEFLWIAHKII